ncbi:MAG TPA: hypothetical protein VGN20_27330 [Mucilaginibacter sp.]|jgi:hypothetical protein
MKKIGLSILAILFAGATLIANVPPAHKKVAKQATCTSCPSGQKCTKATCPNQGSCCE